MRLKVDKITVNQLYDFVRLARPLDLLECVLGSGQPLVDMKLEELKNSMCLYDADNGDVYCIWGIENDGVLDRVIWMLCTENVELNSISFLRFCKSYLKDLQETHPLLWNYVWLGNELHVKWLKWMGAYFGETVDINGEPFQYFYFMKE